MPSPSVVRRTSTFSNISSETNGPIVSKCYMEPPWDGRTKVCSNGPGHMPKMVKTLKNLLLHNQKADDLESWYAALGARVCTRSCSNDDPGLTLSYFTTRSNLVPYTFVWGKGKGMAVLETVVVYDIRVGRCS